MKSASNLHFLNLKLLVQKFIKSIEYCTVARAILTKIHFILLLFPLFKFHIFCLSTELLQFSFREQIIEWRYLYIIPHAIMLDCSIL